ncbi:MAG: aldo/keto reductase [Gemmatimonadetes bacterium]|nr:aldo/keto reductase [Gemmatimonadota bacterium]
MQYRRFGKTNWQISEISLGGSWFYGRPEYGLLPVAHGVGMVERALELGINYFDTAPLYGQGRSEKVLGHALKGVTEPYYLATKVGYFPSPYDYTRDTVWRGFEASLQRLQRDSVDLVQIHEAEQAGWDGIFGKGRTLEALLEMQEQGLVKHIGLTGSDLELMRDALKESDAFVSVITFLKYDLLVQTAKEVLIPTATERDVAVILASPLHFGLLGSKRDAWMKSGRFADLYPKLDKVEALLADEPGDMPDTGLRYLLSDPQVSMILTGAANTTELETSTAVSDGRHLSPELIARINAIPS